MPPGGVVRWTFNDLATLESYELEINPSDGGSPQYRKNITYQNTIAPGGRTLIFEGKDEPITLEWSGKVLSQEQHETFVDWFDKRHQILLVDDLQREYMVYITSYEPKRERSALNQWKHTYTMKATVLDWVEGATPGL